MGIIFVNLVLSHRLPGEIRFMVPCPEEALCRGDEIHFYSIFHNILLNARDALVEVATPDPRIRITVEEEKDRLHIRIKDITLIGPFFQFPEFVKNS